MPCTLAAALNIQAKKPSAAKPESQALIVPKEHSVQQSQPFLRPQTRLNQIAMSRRLGVNTNSTRAFQKSYKAMGSGGEGGMDIERHRCS